MGTISKIPIKTYTFVMGYSQICKEKLHAYYMYQQGSQRKKTIAGFDF